jgi:hypothetical protein
MPLTWVEFCTLPAESEKSARQYYCRLLLLYNLNKNFSLTLRYWDSVEVRQHDIGSVSRNQALTY